MADNQTDVGALTKQVGELKKMLCDAADHLKMVPALEARIAQVETDNPAAVAKLTAEVAEIKGQVATALAPVNEDNANAKAASAGFVLDHKNKNWEGGYKEPENALKGIGMARVLRAFMLGKCNEQKIPQVLQDVYRDKNLSKVIERALSTQTLAGGGAFLMDTLLSSEAFPLLRDTADIFQLGARQIGMPTGSLTIPGLATGSVVGWMGELAAGGGTKPTFRQVKYTSKKGKAIVVVSNDLLAEADVAIDMMVRDDLMGALRNLLTYTACHGAGTEHSPRGIANDPRRTQFSWGTYINQLFPIEMAAAIKDTNTDLKTGRVGWLFDTDVEKVLMSLITGTGDWIFQREMVERGTLFGYPYRTTTLITQGARTADPDNAALFYRTSSVFFGRWDELLVPVTREMRVEKSTEATVLDENGTETNIWDMDASAIRLITTLDMGLRQAASMGHCADVWVPVA